MTLPSRRGAHSRNSTDNSVKTTITATQVSSSSNLDLDEMMDAMGAPSSGDADELFA
jgi:hypothetical protein